MCKFPVLLASLLTTFCLLDDNKKSEPNEPVNQFVCLDGKSFGLKASADRKALVLIFVTTDCPIANSYLPQLSRLQQQFKKSGIDFVMIHEGINQTKNQLLLHAKEFDVSFAIAMDEDHAIARSVGATKTPEVCVIGREGQVLYQGRIDNLYQAFGKKRSTATRGDLQIALSEIDSGGSVSLKKTESVGCTISTKRAAD